jgi:hypothetical protein
MIIPTRNHKDAFKRIQQRGVQQACAVVIFVSNECDSLGTLKILTVRLSSSLSRAALVCGGRLFTVCSDSRLASHSQLGFHSISLSSASVLADCAQKLLQSENLSYKVKPVASYDDLLRARQSIAQDEVCLISVPQRKKAMSRIECPNHSPIARQVAPLHLPLTDFCIPSPSRRTHLRNRLNSPPALQISSIIMINCGGTIDIVEFLQPPPDATIYILDSHRPYHLNNVREHIQQVCSFFRTLSRNISSRLQIDSKRSKFAINIVSELF